MKVAFSMHVFGSQEEMMGVIPKLAELGYDGLEFWDQNLANVDIEHLRNILKDNGIEAAQLCPYFDFTSGEERWRWSVKMAEVYIQRCLRLETSLIRTLTGCPWKNRIPIPPEGEVLKSSVNATDAHWKAALSGLKKICSMGEKHSIHFSLETINGLLDSSASVLELIYKVGANNLGVNLQVPLPADHEKGMTALDSVEKLGRHVIHVHANNYVDSRKLWPRCFLDEGYMDYGAILKRLTAFGFEGYVSVEHANYGGRSPLEIAEHEIKYLKNLIGP